MSYYYDKAKSGLLYTVLVTRSIQFWSPHVKKVIVEPEKGAEESNQTDSWMGHLSYKESYCIWGSGGKKV